MRRNPFSLPTLALLLFFAAARAYGADPAATPWSWQQSQAAIDPKGDLKWKPHPFVFEKGASVRYIDFEAGDDAKLGDTPTTAWKHHPWDPAATSQAQAAKGLHTYV